MKKSTLQICGFAIFCIAILNLQSCKNCDPVTVYYTEQEPYEEEVRFKETLTYETIGEGTQIKRSPGFLLAGTNPRITVLKLVRNTSDLSGTFTLTATVISGSERATVFGTRDIAAGQAAELEGSTEVTPNTFKDYDNYELGSLQIIAPTVERTKMVTKTREVKKSRKCNPCEEDCNSKK